MMGRQDRDQRQLFYEFSLDEMVPPDHLLRRIHGKRCSRPTLTGGLWSLGGVGPGHQLVDAGGGPTVDELGENVGCPGQRIDGVKLASFKERSNHGPSRRATIVPGE